MDDMTSPQVGDIWETRDGSERVKITEVYDTPLNRAWGVRLSVFGVVVSGRDQGRIHAYTASGEWIPEMSCHEDLARRVSP